MYRLCLTLFFFWFCCPTAIVTTAAAAEHPFSKSDNAFIRGDVVELDLMAVEVFQMMRSKKQLSEISDDEAKRLKEIAELGTEKMEEVLKGLEIELKKNLDTLQSQTAKDLFLVKQEFYKEFSEIKGRSELSESETSKILDRVDGTIAPLIRSRILEGGAALDPVVSLVEAAAAQTRMAFAMLMFSQAYAVSEYIREASAKTPADERNFPQPRISLNTYVVISDLLSDGVESAQTLFPQLPEFAFGNVRDKNGALNPKPFQDFVMSFAIPGKRLITQAHGDRLAAAAILMEETIRIIDQYRRNAFPFMDRSDQSKIMTAQLIDSPGFSECFALAAGVERSDQLEGAVCEPEKFKSALQTYVAYHGQNAGYGIHASLMGYFESGSKASIEEIQKQMDGFVAVSFDASVVENWKKASEAIFKDPKLKEIRGNGLALHGYFADKLVKNGINPMLGFGSDYNDTVEAVADVLKGIEKKGLTQFDKIERIDSITDCRPYLKGQSDSAPAVVFTKRLIPSDPSEEKWTSFEASTSSYERALWMHEVEVGNAVTIQSTHRPREKVAGLLKWTLMSRMMANLVFTQGLIGGMPHSSDPADFGVKITENLLDRLVAKEYGLPVVMDVEHGFKVAWEPVMSEFKHKHEAMMAQFRENHTDLFEDADNDAAVKKAFQIRYSKEMALAAKMMRKWKTEQDNLDMHKEARKSRHEVCRIFGLPPEFCPDEMAGQVNGSLVKHFFPTLKFNYFKRTLKQASNESNQAFLSRIRQATADAEMTPDQFLDELGAAKGVVGGDEPVEGLTSAEIGRIKKYQNDYGQDNYRMLLSSITRFQKLYDHAESTYNRKRKFLDQAVSMTEHLFPPLSLKVDFGSGVGTRLAYTVFDGSEVKFLRIMRGYKAAIVGQIEKIQNIEDPSEVSSTLEVHPFFEEYLPHLGAVDQMLSYFPDQKKTVCQIQEQMEFWEGVANKAETGAVGVAMATAYMGPVGIAISAGITGVIVAVDITRAMESARLAKEHRKLNLAVWTQVNFDQRVKNKGMVDALDERAMGDAIYAGVNIALLSVAAGGKLVKNAAVLARVPRALRGAARTWSTGMRTANKVGQLGKAEGVFKYWARFPMRMVRGLRGSKLARGRLIEPLRRFGLIEKWQHLKLHQRMAMPVGWLQKIRMGWLSKPTRFMQHMFVVVGEYPLGFFGVSWGRGIVGTSFWAYTWYHTGRWLTNFFTNHLYTMPTDVMWERVQESPEEYADLWQLVLEGQLTKEQMIAVVEADDKYSMQYREAFREIFEALETEEGEIDAEILPRVLEMRKTVEADLLDAQTNPKRASAYGNVVEMVESLAGLGSKPENFQSEVWSLQKTKRRLDRIIWQLEREKK